MDTEATRLLDTGYDGLLVLVSIVSVARHPFNGMMTIDRALSAFVLCLFIFVLRTSLP